jgi:hypothetical protein
VREHSFVLNREGVRKVNKKLTLIVLPLISTLFGLSWAISSPPGSASDEIYHLGSVWCAWGENEICKFDGEPQETGRRNITLTPEFSKAGCFRSDIDKQSKSAECYTEKIVHNDRFAWEMNSGNYPGLTYTVLRTFATNNIDLSVIIMRVFNYSLFTISIILAFYSLRRKTFYASMLSIFITSIPVSIFFLTSINPNSWTIIGIGLYWAFLWDLFNANSSKPSKRLYLGLVFLSILSIGSRSDASIYILVLNIILFVYLFITRALIKNRLKLILVTLISVWAFLQFLYNTQFEAESKSVNSERGLSLFIQNFRELPAYYLGLFGGKGPEEWPFGLGWFDTPIPSVVPVLAGLNILLAGIAFVRLKDSMQKFYVAILPFFMILIPLTILQLRGSNAMYFLQPRYLLPLLIVFFGILLIDFNKSKYFNAVTGIIIVILSIINAISLHTNIKRYTVGLNSEKSIFQSVDWWWDIPYSPSMNWIVGTVTFPILLSLIFFKLFNMKLDTKVSQ